MPTPADLSWQSMTAALQELQTPNSFVSTLLFSNHHLNSTDKINVDAWVGGRRMAPFRVPGASAAVVPGRSKRFSTIEAPNIRIKRPFEANQMMLSRTPGSPIFISPDQQRSEIQNAIQGDLRYMREMIDDTIEWMACQALTGVITYAITDANGAQGDQFTLDFGRPGTHTVTLVGTDLWSEAAATATKSIQECVQDADRLVNNATGANVDICIMGKDAATAFIKRTKGDANLQTTNIRIGTLDLSQRFRNNGAKYLGTMYGVEFWEYARTVLDEFGNTINLVDPKKAHFVSTSPIAENILEYGAIADTKAAGGVPLMTEVFAKSWEEEDPSGWMYLAQSRPLPVPRRPETYVTMTVAA